MYQIIIAHPNDINLSPLLNLISTAGHSIISVNYDLWSGFKLAREVKADALITTLSLLPDQDSDWDWLMLTPVPSLVIIYENVKEDNPSSYLPPSFGLLFAPFSARELACNLDNAVRLFRQWHRCRIKLQHAQHSLEERKLIEQAKGYLMEARGLSEAGAYTTMRKMSMDSRRPLAEVARSLLLASKIIERP